MTTDTGRLLERDCDGEGPICPYCDRQFTADEPSYFYDRAMDCDNCGATFDVHVDTSTSWHTSARAASATGEEG